MIILTTHLVGVAVGETKGDPVLVVDSDRVLSRTIIRERVQLVAWRNAKLLQARGAVQQIEFPLNPLPEQFRHSPRYLGVGSIPDVLSGPIGE